MPPITIQAGPLIPVPQYLAVSDADDYFATRLDGDAWSAATPQRKQAALVTATRAIDRLNFVGIKATETQITEFPRMGLLSSGNGVDFAPGTPLATPVDVLIACCEEALVRLDGVDPELEIDNLRVTSSAYASVRETYDRAFTTESARAGIMSQVAWNFLVPWLADALSVTLARV